jgi:hypothetical protein
LANINPSGENFIYNFDYYIKQGLLNQDNLNNDLYYIESSNASNKRGWLGVYARLKELNKERDELIPI